jgi:hypothetical protein
MRGDIITIGRLGGVSRFLMSAALLCLGIVSIAPPAAYAAESGTTSGFSLQVSPSPLVQTIKPGVTSKFDLQIRNTSDESQNLKMGLRAFTINSTTGKVDLKNSQPGEVKDFVSFSNPNFSVEAGQIFTQHIIVATPKSAGFTYSFAVVISQQNPPQAKNGESAIQGSVAVFTLLSVDRPGATSKLSLSELQVGRHVYEYLPATISVKLKNSGNTLVQPKGTIYIQRKSNDTKPLASIELNKAGGYILPNSERTMSVDWKDGFPHYTSYTGSDGQTHKKLSWDSGDFTKLRFGRYVAKVVAVYNDNGRDVPIQAEITFWVIPWRVLLIILAILAICIVGLVTIIRKSSKAIPHPHRSRKNDAKK